MSRALRPEAPVFLVGFMGSGKTTVGRILAGRLRWDFADTDEIVERASGQSVETIFSESGEGRFREAEWDALRAVAAKRRIVVATGGGLFLGVAQRALIRAHGWSCWLDAPLPVAAARLQTGEVRPLWAAGDALARRAMFERRRAAYALADGRVDAGTSCADDVASAILQIKNTLWR